MNCFIIFTLRFLFLLSFFGCHTGITMTIGVLTLDHFEGNQLETYEEISSEQSDFDIFNNLTFYFTCTDRSPGFYADVDYNCRIFHICDNYGNGVPVICANDTVFDQRQRICTDEKDIDCQQSYEWYYLNQLIHSEEITEADESKTVTDDVIPSVLPITTA